MENWMSDTKAAYKEQNMTEFFQHCISNHIETVDVLKNTLSHLKMDRTIGTHIHIYFSKNHFS